MNLVWIDADAPLPDPAGALPGGLLAAGSDLSTHRLAEAYRLGIFPWFSPGDPVLWWSPDPHMVLACDALRISHSLAKRLRRIARTETLPNAECHITLNADFSQVIRECSARSQTWITPNIIAVYEAWHHQGRVHSIETWQGNRLVGGLYGVSLGRFFFGESMFTRVSDAGKIALVYLVRYLQAHGVPYIDCQQETAHLATLGASPIPRTEFLTHLDALKNLPGPPWGRGRLTADGRLIDETTLTMRA
ncbi:MAG: leucyl/phenylalanyl-tRNA--protein transferase [Alcaligenaceae bacterium]|nr:leucyl/phenylalanyl-tRNA--protein transferase [Alcaligenaceae bacterium]